MPEIKGIFCLEGEWSRNLAQASSVEPVLHLLKCWEPYRVPYIHRTVATPASLEKYLRIWAQKRYAAYPILYLAFHGNPGVICMGSVCRTDTEVTLASLASVLQGRCKGRIIYFASCGTLDHGRHHLGRFLRDTGALAVCGYTREVDWLSSTAFELLVMAAMQDNALTIGGARAMKERIVREAGFLARKLQFRMIVREPEA
jgi:hypothetical protein